jgi:hypothetical protein
MWNLDDASHYRLVVKVALPWAWTFADTQHSIVANFGQQWVEPIVSG